MNRSNPEKWSRVGETALLSLVFLAPLAVHSRTWDPSALRTALAQAVALTLAAAWVLKGLARGRWEVPPGAWPALAPALAWGGWTLLSFLSGPHRLAAFPGLAMTASAWVIFAAALLEFGGARHAARLAFWTTAAAALVAAGDAAGWPVPASGFFAGGSSLAAFAAAALPAVLALRLDPESSPARRLFSASAACALALAAGRSGGAEGLAAFLLSALAFSAAAFWILRGPAARREAWIGLACGLLAAAAGATRVSGPPVLSLAPLLGASGRVGAGLFALTASAACAVGLLAAHGLRRRGALSEAGYAAAFAAGFGAWALARGAGLTPASGPGAWLAWASAGVAAGMAPLARPRGVVRTYPLPFGADARRLLRGPLLALFAVLTAGPALWLASDVSFNRAVAEARASDFAAAYADAGRVWPGSPAYPSALYLRGRALAGEGRPAEALDAYARLDEVSPDFARVHARKAEAYALLENWPAAARERAREDSLRPDDAANLVAWAEAARAAGDLDAARLAAARARALAPEDPAVLTALAENALMEKKLAAESAARKRAERKGLALKPRTR